MADLIDRQTIIETIHSAIYPYFCGAEDGDALSKDEKLVLSVNKAVCTAIKALPSAQPDVPDIRVGDMISRQAAIDAIKKRLTMAKYPLNKSKYNEGEIDAYETSISDIDEVPSVDAEPVRHGKWLHKNSTFKNHWLCSECGYTWYFDTKEASYCPHCGALMDEVK